MQTLSLLWSQEIDIIFANSKDDPTVKKIFGTPNLNNDQNMIQIVNEAVEI